jgi:uncharacterized membrane protein
MDEGESPPPASTRSGDSPLAPVARHRLVVPIVVAHAVVMLLWSLFRHHNFGSSTDLGAYHSVAWNFAMRDSLWNSVERIHHWSTHMELGLLWLWVPYRFFPSPVWLFLTQSAAAAAAALPIEAVARRVTRDQRIALLAVVAMLLTPQLLLAEIDDFHAVTLCALPLSILVWGIEVDSALAIGAAAIAVLSLREQMGLLLVAAAAAWVLRQGRRRLGSAIVLGASGLAFFLFAAVWAIPQFGAGQSLRYAAQYQRLGATPGAAIKLASEHPLTFLTMAFEGQRKLFPIALASGGFPLLLLSLRSLRKASWPLLLAAPLLGVQLMSGDPEKWSINSHYGSPIVPLFAMACTASLAFIPAEKNWRLYAAAGWAALTALHTIMVIPSPVGPGGPIDPTYVGSPREAALRKALSLISGDDSVCTQDNVLPHVSDRMDIHEWPDGELTDDIILLDQDGPSRTIKSRERLSRAASRIRTDPAFTVLIDDAGVLLARRKNTDALEPSGGGEDGLMVPAEAPTAPAESAAPEAPTAPSASAPAPAPTP